ncbi:PKD domain-containing protein [Methanosarcina sp. KYL-1]|uniref:lectin like domain-containing protein n=1 Tax=Methanosarcina sp. KYL-1 TaxID=2602068 RepID=UPI002101727F|nr:lectin like domain-containing protein [Methanosarcina sp. KYL-1]MCQ1535575.1 PKD domain-containing protein [Methanosarcina sp. KYL-1]
MVNLIAFTGEAAPGPETLQANETASQVHEFAVTPLNPEFVEYQQLRSMEPVSTQDEYGYASGLGYIPSPVDLSGLSKPESERNERLLWAFEPELPAVYDLRSEGLVTPVKNQGNTGSCWAFASTASLESYLLGTAGESRDFSENNMKNLVSVAYPEGFDMTPAEGGNAFMSAAYLARWTGPVNESDDPYNDASAYSPQGLPVQKHTQEILFLPGRTESPDNEYIKRAIMEYGAVYSAFYWALANYNAENHSYYYTTSRSPQGANHAITLVGWNDSFDMNRFSQIPPGDGAFIVKNSWGEDWGEEGYFYISYYDLKLGYDENAVFTTGPRDNYDYIYQYDPLGWVGNTGYGSTGAWGGNVFSSEGNETLRAVGFYTTDLDTEYEIYIYRDPLSGPVNSEGVYAVRENGTSPLPGYHTHVLNSPVTLSPGENFSVVIKFSNPSEENPLAIEKPLRDYSSRAQSNPGESYMSPDGNSWEDLNSRIAEANLCIKAFTTTDELPEAKFSASATSGVSPLTVEFTDLSENAFSLEWDLDGDGEVDSTTRNPVYTYELHGSYNVSLKVNNRNGFDSETKNSYITVESLSILSTEPERDVLTFEDEMQNFSITTSHPCTISWYLNGMKKESGTGITASSYLEGSLYPGSYNVTANAAAGAETVPHSWNWTVSYWNPWDNSTSHEGENISTEELQEAIHCQLNGLTFPYTGANATDDRFDRLIRSWLGE